MFDIIAMLTRPALLVSLPRNDPELARAAIDAGAEGLKVHINLQHAAADEGFGSWQEESTAIEQICALGVPVGIVPGTAENMCSPADVQRMADAGIDFVDAYLTDMPVWMLDTDTGIDIMAAVAYQDLPPHGTPEGLTLLPQIRMIEASVLPHEGYGKPLCLADLKTYAHLAEMMRPGGVPVVVPSQRAILPQQVASLHKVGVRGILIGAIVTGKQPDSIRRATEEFRAAVDAVV